MKRAEQRQVEAKERQAIYDSLSTEQKLALATSRRGVSKREVDRLMRESAKKKGGKKK